jgi:YVTN family beta-propeller protein
VSSEITLAECSVPLHSEVARCNLSVDMVGSRTRMATVAMIALVVGACGSGQVQSPAANGSASTSSPQPATTHRSAAPSAAVGRTVAPQAVINFGTEVGAMTVGSTGIWALTNAGIVRIDATTNKVATSYPLPPTSDGYGLAVGVGALWVSDFDNNVVYRLDPATGKRIATIATPAGPLSVLVVDGAVWVANHHAGSVSRIDPATNEVVKTISVGPAGPGGPGFPAAVAHSLWVGFGFQSTVVHVDTQNNTVIATVNLPSRNTLPYVVDPTHVWAFYNGESAQGIAVLNASGTGVTTTIDVGGAPGFSAVVSAAAVWVPVLPTSGSVGTVVAIDPATNAIVDGISIAEGTPDNIAIGFGSAWVELNLQGMIERIPLAALTVSH